MKVIAKLGVLLVVLAAVPAFAQDEPNAFRRYEIGGSLFSFSHQGSVKLYGGDFSFTAFPQERLGFVADLAVHRGTSKTGVDINTVTYRFGPKLVTRLGGRLTDFVEALVGGSRIEETGTANLSGGVTFPAAPPANGFGIALGAGLDFAIKPWIAYRIGQIDYSYLHFGSAHTSSEGFRVGTGLVFRFGSH